MLLYVVVLPGCGGFEPSEPPGTGPTPRPVSLTDLRVSPQAVAGGSSATATVVLSSTAGGNGVTVALVSNSAVARVPSSVVIPAGSESANFSVTTERVSSTVTVGLTATYAGDTRSTSLAVTP